MLVPLILCILVCTGTAELCTPNVTTYKAAVWHLPITVRIASFQSRKVCKHSTRLESAFCDFEKTVGR